MKVAQVAFDHALRFLEGSGWKGITSIDIPAAETIGAGDQLEFCSVAEDDFGRAALLARIPGNATALGQMSNEDITGILYSLDHVWHTQTNRALTPFCLLSDRFDDRLTSRCVNLRSAIPRLTLAQVCDIAHHLAARQTAELPVESAGSSAEAGFEVRLHLQLHNRLPLADVPLMPLGTQVPAGWARSRAERIDLLAVDRWGRLVVVELKVVDQAHVSSLRPAVFQSLRYWEWVKLNRRALQTVYGRDLVTDIEAEPTLFIVDAGGESPKDVLRFRPAAAEGLEPFVRFFQCPSIDAVTDTREAKMS